jgi:alpha-amylase/alpha-mannosidase (GH57 family)
MTTALVIHGHFYQPPRENPWTGEVEREAGAEPFHDWNERIYSECYRPNAYARILDDHGRIERIVNNYAHLSFNFGPTLLSWMERHHSLTYARILEADRISAKVRGGHGNAIAQAYNHAILPLANERDRITQVRWGMRDFEHRFGRKPEAMWLPETACNDKTLATLIEEGLKYVILSPYQAHRIRKIGDTEWHDASGGKIDTGVAYRWFHRDGSKRHIDIFFYDGIRSRAVAFEGILRSSRALIEQFTRATGGPGRIISAATDGESYGHHSKWGDRCLAHAMEVEAPKAGFWVTNYGEFLERHPPVFEVEIAHGPDGLGTSWSCAHGVGRWYRDCGCHTGGGDGWTQTWRTPLRKALDVVRDRAIYVFESIGGELFHDPWAARDAYIDVILDPRQHREKFLERHAKKRLDEGDRARALTLLEMQRHAQLMYTSCGWFFSDVSGIETVQILKYASRALDEMQYLEITPPKEAFFEVLAAARSNKKDVGSGADVFRKLVETTRVTPRRVAAHLTMTSLVDGTPQTGEIGLYNFEQKKLERRQDGRITMCTGQVILRDRATTQ